MHAISRAIRNSYKCNQVSFETRYTDNYLLTYHNHHMQLDLVRFLRPPSADPDSHAPQKGNMRSFFVRGIAVGVVGLVTIVTRILVSNGQPTAMFKDR